MINGLLRSTLLAAPLMIACAGQVALLLEMHRRRAWEGSTERNVRYAIQTGEKAGRDAAAMGAVLDRLVFTRSDRHLRPVRDNRNA